MNFEREYSSRRNLLYTVAVLCCFVQSAMAEMRTWTSASGATIEAELVGVDAGRAMLRNANGKEFAIDLTKISAADQAYIKTKAPESSIIAQPAAPVTPSTMSQTTTITPGKFFAYKDAQSLTGGLPESIKLRQPDNAKFMLIQYGPEAGDVLYVAFDPPGPQVAADAAYVWSPSLTGFKIPRRIEGKSRKIKEATAYVMDIPISTQFGDLGVRGNIELISGAQDWWLFFVVGNFEVLKSGKSSSFQVCGFIFEFAVGIAETQSATPLRLLGDIAFTVGSHPEKGSTTAHLKLGQFDMFPGKNMKSEIKVVIVDAKGTKAEEHGLRINNNDLFTTKLAFVPEKLKSGEKYTTTATIDLGPIFGPQTSESAFTVQ